jgi:hypothetical protein
VNSYCDNVCTALARSDDLALYASSSALLHHLFQLCNFLVFSMSAHANF